MGSASSGVCLARHIKEGVAGLADQLPEGKAENIATGGIPSGLAPDLLVKIQTVFADAFQNIFIISLVFVIAAFLHLLVLEEGSAIEESRDAASSRISAWIVIS